MTGVRRDAAVGECRLRYAGFCGAREKERRSRGCREAKWERETLEKA